MRCEPTQSPWPTALLLGTATGLTLGLASRLAFKCSRLASSAIGLTGAALATTTTHLGWPTATPAAIKENLSLAEPKELLKCHLGDVTRGGDREKLAELMQVAREECNATSERCDCEKGQMGSHVTYYRALKKLFAPPGGWPAWETSHQPFWGPMNPTDQARLFFNDWRCFHRPLKLDDESGLIVGAEASPRDSTPHGLLSIPIDPLRYNHFWLLVFDPHQKSYVILDNMGNVKPATIPKTPTFTLADLVGRSYRNADLAIQCSLSTPLATWKKKELHTKTWEPFNWTMPKWRDNNCYLAVAWERLSYYHRLIASVSPPA